MLQKRKTRRPHKKPDPVEVPPTSKLREQVISFLRSLPDIPDEQAVNKAQ